MYQHLGQGRKRYMFHVFLAAPILGLIAVYGAIVLFVLSIPFCVGGFLQLVFSICSQSKLLLFLPGGMGALGIVACLIWLSESFPWQGIVLYWAIYGVFLWLIWLVVSQIKKFILRHLK